MTVTYNQNIVQLTGPKVHMSLFLFCYFANTHWRHHHYVEGEESTYGTMTFNKESEELLIVKTNFQ